MSEDVVVFPGFITTPSSLELRTDWLPLLLLFNANNPLATNLYSCTLLGFTIWCNSFGTSSFSSLVYGQAEGYGLLLASEEELGLDYFVLAGQRPLADLL